MTSYVAVLPSIHQPWTDECLASCQFDPILVVDNTVRNWGVAASWNQGIEQMYRDGADWLIIVSAGVRFGESGGLDLVAEMEDHPRALAVEAGPCRWDNEGFAVEGFGWHLIALHRRLFDAVGRFDENYFPAYYEDVDFGRRVQLWLRDHPNESDWLGGAWWPKVTVAGSLAGTAHGVSLGGAKVEPLRLEAYYVRKWGGLSGFETYDHPFNNLANDLTYWPR